MASNPLASVDHPYALCVVTSRPPGSAGTATSTSGGAHARDPLQTLCPYTGSNLTSGHPLRVPAASGRGDAFGVRCLVPVPLHTMMGGGGDDMNATVFVGHGGAGGARGGSKDDHAFLVGRHASGASSGGCGSGTNPRWKVRLPETLSNTPQSMAVSPDGRFLAAGSTNGTCFLWEWTGGEDNLIKVWKAHYRPVTCVQFDNDDGATLFTAGEDGVVNAWCLIDLVDRDCPTGGSIHPFRTWSEHHLPVTSLCVLPGSGRGSTRLLSSSLDRNLILMEVGGSDTVHKLNDSSSGARTLARMGLPSGLHAVIADASGGRAYGAGADGHIYCVDLCAHAIQETLDGAGTVVNVHGASGGNAGFQSVLSGSHLLSSTSSAAGPSTDQGKYLSELKGHAKAVTCLALLDPADMTSSNGTGTGARLASGSDDGTVRIWDLHSRSCVKVLRPWAPSSEGATLASAASSSSSCPPITGLISVPRSSLTSSGGTLDMTSDSSTATSLPRPASNRRGNARGDPASMFRPLKRFVRGTSVANHDGDNGDNASSGCTPILWPRRDETHVQFWEAPLSTTMDDPASRKRTRASEADDGEERANDKAEIARLQRALEESQAVVERWQNVNNQLVAKLQGGG